VDFTIGEDDEDESVRGTAAPVEKKLEISEELQGIDDEITVIEEWQASRNRHCYATS
jgi:hypothetical protein